MIATMNKFLTLSFSGAGHLLPYHLGVATSLLSSSSSTTKKKLPPIHAVSGSSSGAIAATLYVCFPNQIQEYTDRFISDGGRAMYHLKEMIYDDDGNTNTSSVDNDTNNNNTSLHIATTRCSDGSLQLFDFPSKLQSSIIDKDRLLNCLQASCKIPPHFHPSDVLEKSRWLSSSSYAIYPEQDGIIINGESYVDGGISAPAPPTPLDKEEGALRVVVSPISGTDYNNESNTIRISPMDNSWKVPMDIKCRGGFSVYSSMQNLQAMQNSAGLASSLILQDWYERGISDGERMIDKMTND